MENGHPEDSSETDHTETSQVFKLAVETGVHRLRRGGLEMLTSGFIAGMNVTFGVIAAGAVTGAVIGSFGNDTEQFANVLGAMLFPIGFMFVVIGRSELFTENFLVPTASVIARRERLVTLLRLWFFTLAGNLIGALTMGKLLTIEHYHGVPSQATIQHIQHMAEFLVIERDWDASFFAGLFAGWLITLMTWLLLTTKQVIAKIVIIWTVGFLIMINKFNHVVVNMSEIMVAYFSGNELITLHGWLTHNFAPTILGNMFGGLIFVTTLEYLKVMRVKSLWD